MSNTDQIDFWNGKAGERWVSHAMQLDEMLSGFAARLLNDAGLQAGECVLDIGCGGGTLTLGAAARGCEATGVDVSAPLLSLARGRANDADSSAQFVEADASVWTTETQFDAMISRFGVMFFDDPVAAFTNIRSNMKSGGRMTFACWQPLATNAWALAPLMAAMPYFKEPPQQGDPTAPGPFAFGDKDRLTGILGDAGWTGIEINSWRGDLTLPGETISEAAAFMMELGPLTRLLEEQAIDASIVETALASQLAETAGEDGRAKLEGAVWYVQASA